MAQAGVEHGELYWKEKYMQMEAKMAQFHLQASEIRTKLAVKISALTDDCEASRKRADSAEEELRLLKEKIKEEQKESEEQVKELRTEVGYHKDNAEKAKESLEHAIEEMNEERVLVHERLKLLKSSIASRLKEVEDQKKLLFEANERATVSLYEMQCRVQELTAELNELKRSTAHSSIACGRDHSAQHDDTSFEISNRSLSPISNSHGMDISMSPPIPTHADKAKKRSPRRLDIESPPAKDGQLQFPLVLEDINHPQDTSSGTTSETIRLSVEEDKKEAKVVSCMPEVTVETVGPDCVSVSPKWSVDVKKKKKSATLPKTRSVAKKEPSTPHHSSLIETFGSITRKFRGFTDSHQNALSARDLRRTQSAGKKESKVVRTASGSKSRKHISTPQVGKDMLKIKPKASESPKHFLRVPRGKSSSTLSNTLEEDETPPSKTIEKMEVTESNNTVPVANYLSSSLPSPMLSSILPRTKRSQSFRTPRKKPPTPPVHQVPVWESKIYSLSRNGFVLRGNDVIRSSSHDFQIPIRYHSLKEKATDIYKRDPPNVPVYTKLFGKVVLLRENEFPAVSEWSNDDDLTDSVASELTHFNRSYDSNSAIPLRRNGSPGQIRAIKRANSSHSVTSSEGDYSIPPDAVSLGSDSSEPEHKLYKTGKTGAPAAASSRVSSSSASPENGTSPLLSPTSLQAPPLVQEKCGFLFKLIGSSLTWRKRWFVLKPNKLQCYISPVDVGKKPAGEIEFTASTEMNIKQEDGTQPILHLSTGKKDLYITADSYYLAEDWIRALNVTLNRPRTLGLGKAGRYHSIVQNNIAFRGWIERSSKDGKKRKLWACLGSSSLYFFSDEKEQEFVGRMVIKDCKISPTDNETSINIKFPVHNGQQRADVLLAMNSKMEKDAWLFWVTVASGSVSLSLGGSRSSVETVGTPYERLVTRIMYVATCTSDNLEDSIPVGAASPLWREQILSFCREGLQEPLTTLSSEGLHTEANKMIKLCQRFLNSAMDSSSIDFHVTLAQQIASSCLLHHELQGEIYAVLIKQCNGKHTKQSTTSASPKRLSTSSQKTSKTGDETAVLQVWKLLALIIPLFLPHKRMLWLLKAHLHRHMDDKNEIGQYAAYCQRTLSRAACCGCRVSPPSRTEAVSIFLQNPYHHSLPFSIPVHFHSGNYQVMSFDASTTVDEFTQRTCQQAGIRLPSISGFALFTDDPNVQLRPTEHCISTSSKVCDIISQWEHAYRKTDSSQIDTSRMVKVTLSQHFTSVKNRECETEKEKILIAYQASNEIASDRFPVCRDLAMELAALCAQMDEGDMRSADHGFKEILDKFYPKRYITAANKQQLRQLRAKLCERWALLKSSPGDCARVLLTAIRNCPVYGMRLFLVETSKKHKRGLSIWLAIHEHGVDELNLSSMESERRYKYSDIMTYGGCDGKLAVIVETDGVVKKHLYSVSVEKAAEIVHLLTEYMQSAAMTRKCC